MDPAIVELWADIGSEEYWEDLPKYMGRSKVEVDFEDIYIPFDERWPQPGFIGKRYFKLPKRKRIVVIGQNPRASASRNCVIKEKDIEMRKLIWRHDRIRTKKSLNRLFKMMREFMLMPGSWRPIKNVQRHVGLRLDDIAYLNLIPLATQGDRIDIKTFVEAYKMSTKLQLKLLKPHKILFYGKVPYCKFKKWEGNRWDVRYIEQRNYKDAPDVKRWLNS